MPVGLDQLLQKARKYLTPWVQALPEPWPGCILFFSVASEDEAATVFHVKASTFESAWREGTIRIRQWAWARQLESVMLRIDWVEDITQQPTGSQISWNNILRLRKKAFALADPFFEHAVLLPQMQLSAGTHKPVWLQQIMAGHVTAQPILLLHLRGLYLDGYGLAPTFLPRESLTPSASQTNTPTYNPELCRAARPAILSLLERQQPDGSWGNANSLTEHLGIQHTLLQILRNIRPQPAAAIHPDALTQAIGLATQYALQYLNQSGQSCRLSASLSAEENSEQAQALLVIAATANEHIPGIRHLPLLPQTLEHLAQQVLAAYCQGQAEHENLHPTDVARALMASIWQFLALRAYLIFCANSPYRGEVAPYQLPAEMPAAWLHHLISHFEMPDSTAPDWLSIAIIEANQFAGHLQLSSAERAYSRTHLRVQLEALQQNLIWPELAIYLDQPRRRQAPFLEELYPHQLSGNHPSQHAALLNRRAACNTLLYWLDQVDAQDARLQQILPPDAGHSQSSLPMEWSSHSLAFLTGGHWILPIDKEAPDAIYGLAVTRLHHWPGAAVLVRRSGESLGVHPASIAALQPHALIHAGSARLQPSEFPILQIPDLEIALKKLAASARQRIQAKVIGVTGCTGKTSTLRMLAQCLLGMSSAHQDAMLLQDPKLQMINWSDTAPWVFAELALPHAAPNLPLLAPDVLVVTNLPQNMASLQTSTSLEAISSTPQQHESAQQQILQLMHCMRRGSTLVFNCTLVNPDALHDAAVRYGIRLVSFGPHSKANIREQHYDASGLLQIKLQPGLIHHHARTPEALQIQLQADGHHMALNAQAAIAVLHAMQSPLEAAIHQLACWQPLPGTGQPEKLPGNINLLDHSNTSEILAIKTAIGQLLTHAPQANQRVIVLAGVHAHHCSLETAQMQLEPLIRSAQARRVLLYGSAMYELAEALADQTHVSWYEDLNQLTSSLLRSLHAQDTVLLAGRATTNLGIVTSAIRESAFDYRLPAVAMPVSLDETASPLDTQHTQDWPATSTGFFTTEINSCQSLNFNKNYSNTHRPQKN